MALGGRRWQAPRPMRSPRFRLLHVVTVPITFTFLRGQLGYLAGQGVELHGVSAPPEDGRLPLDAADALQFHGVPMRRSIAAGADALAIGRLAALMRKLRPDIVQAGTPKGGLLGTLAAAAARVPVRIYHVRGLAHDTATGGRRAALLAAERAACAAATDVLCVSDSVRASLARSGLCALEKSSVLGAGSSNGVDATGRFDPARFDPSERARLRARLGIAPDALVIGFVGRLVRDKGIVELAESWTALREVFPAACLLLVGPFEAEDPVPQEIVQRLRSDPRVVIAPAPWGQSAERYAVMDLVCFPTYREGFPNVPLEAAAMRLPVVATRVTGCVDAVVDGTTGVLVPPRDVRALTAACAELLRDEDRRRALGEAGRARAIEHYAPERIWSDMLAFYERLLAARRGRGGGGWRGARYVG